MESPQLDLPEVGIEESLKRYYSESIEQARDGLAHFILIFIVCLILVMVGSIVLTANPFAIASLILITIWALYSSVMSRFEQIGNSLIIKNSDHPFIERVINEVSTNLGLDPATFHVLVTREPDHGVTAIHTPRNHTIIIKAEVFEDLDESDLRVLLVREASQILYHNASLEYLLHSVAEDIEFLGIGKLVKALFGPWLRRIDHTANRLAVLYTRDPEAVIKGLVNLEMGKEAAEIAVKEGVLRHLEQSSRVTKSIAETLRGAPVLVSQIEQILQFTAKSQIPVSQHMVDSLNAGSGPSPTAN